MKAEEMIINDQIRKQVIEGILEKLVAIYIFPEIADSIVQRIRERLENNEYSQLHTAAELVATLNEHMREINGDKHLRLRYSEDVIEENETEEDVASVNQEKERLEHVNYGVYKVERLAGNIGYFDLRNFHNPELVGSKIVAAMNILSDTSALIIDLRHNGGGYPGTVALLCSYFFTSEPVHLNSMYFRTDEQYFQSWTLPYIPGSRYLDKPVYLLTSNSTFSAAEEFAYNMQQLKRVTIIGEVTGGGANPGMEYILHDHFHVFIPNGRSINPVSQMNWEGVGVQPDILTSKEEAYNTAYIDALQHVINNTKQREQQNSIQRIILEEAEKALSGLKEPAPQIQ
ncbi:S41 family peptidase [Paenibacillus sp. N1-5-1-14]|uniref:S41 family peptidase n=1 Tax=Paenibacillus radicibacter TaxID=2972488 RepID=UPI002158C646|nr:S41 family peptidase [Paenibacillus radicibacter]MCR8641603.1 S41 family peptidase [Paenibacillus radicibacter]